MCGMLCRRVSLMKRFSILSTKQKTREIKQRNFSFITITITGALIRQEALMFLADHNPRLSSYKNWSPFQLSMLMLQGKLFIVIHQLLSSFAIIMICESVRQVSCTDSAWFHLWIVFATESLRVSMRKSKCIPCWLPDRVTNWIKLYLQRCKG